MSRAAQRLLALGSLAWALLGPATAARAQFEPSLPDDDDDDVPVQAPSAAAPTTEEGEPAAGAPESGAPADLKLEVFAGAGFGMRGFTRPLPTGAQHLADSVFPAVDLGLSVRVWPERAFSLAFLVRYQTSIAWSVEENPQFALPNRVDVRAERAELSIAPSFRLGDSANSALLAFPIGASLRTLWPEIHGQVTPGYSLLGPHIRAELIAKLNDAVSLRVGPEAQWLVGIDRLLRDDGAGAQGFALGGELAFRAPLGGHFGLELSYRESHAFIPNAGQGRLFVDVERFGTAQFLGSF